MTLRKGLYEVQPCAALHHVYNNSLKLNGDSDFNLKRTLHNELKEQNRPLIQQHKGIRHSTKKYKTSTINCSFSLRCSGTHSLLDRLLNYSSWLFSACGHICMWMQLHCVDSDGSERKCRLVLTQWHTPSWHIHHCALRPYRSEKGREGSEQFHIGRGWRWLTVFLFPLVLLAPPADSSSSRRSAVWLRHTTSHSSALAPQCLENFCYVLSVYLFIYFYFVFIFILCFSHYKDEKVLDISLQMEESKWNTQVQAYLNSELYTTVKRIGVTGLYSRH